MSVSSLRRLASSLSFVSVLALSLGLAACGGSTQDPSSPSAVAEAEEPSASPEGGMAGFVHDAIASANLRADQKTKVDAIEASLKTATESVRAARKDAALTLAAQVKKGALDEAALDAKIDVAMKAAEAAKPAVQDAVQKLHDTLDATQRKAVVDAMRGRLEKARGGDEDEGHGARGRLKKLADQLELTSEQRDAIKQEMKKQLAGHREGLAAKRAEHDKAREHVKAIASAFESDSFDAKALGVGDHLASGAKAMGKGVEKVIAIAVPILTQPQRDKLAGILEARANKS
jgi:hypothetical protein